ncbi:dTDP-4-dehydrorhamnose reductase [Oerskovia flava]|uniref:dTDP-4-dehydrorhamnose reductase n=1 Tax=Oerskovia flava TaxID=2986422 RepID=UPI0022408A83|nr:dTDP-4-dehydrorhamnose reductase [Oerskovia sp. JB1-3-2]
MHWVVTGAGGLLGTELVGLLAARGASHEALTRSAVDITDAPAVARAVAGADVVVNCAAYTDVDGAEAHEADAFAVNAVGPQVLARATARTGARLVQVSTDYVFDGGDLDGSEPDGEGRARPGYAETDLAAPRTAYGRSKLAGEWAVRAEHPDALVLRTAWLYGRHGACFPRTIARAAATRDRLDVVDDQVGQPTWARDVADLMVRLVAARAPAGTYHATSSGRGSWFDLARAVVASEGRTSTSLAAVHPTTSDAFVRPARRPPFSVLGHDALRAVGLAPIGDWRERWELAASDVLHDL